MKLILRRTKLSAETNRFAGSLNNSNRYIVGKSKKNHSCYYLWVRKKGGNGVLHQVYAKSWMCEACKEYILIPSYQKKLDSISWDYLITVTTRTKFQPPVGSILRTKKCLTRFLQALKYRYGRSGGTANFWAIGVTASGRIHYHVLWKGPKPGLKWMKNKWCKLTGCFIVDLSPAEARHTRYLIRDNAGAIPNYEQDDRFLMSDVFKLGRFRRVGHTRRLFPKPVRPKTKWELVRSSANR